MTTGGGTQWDPGDPPEVDGVKTRRRKTLEQAELEGRLDEVVTYMPHEGNCLMFNRDGSDTGLDCTCLRGKRIYFLTSALAGRKLSI